LTAISWHEADWDRNEELCKTCQRDRPKVVY